MAERLQEKYQKVVVPALKEEFGIANVMSVPKIEKITINVGLGKGLKDSKYTEVVENTLRRITGQKPVMVKARKSIAGFKIREGMDVGIKVTLRGKRMWDFLDKLVNVVFPRISDFRGIKLNAVDKAGNFSFGFKEHVAFPEISPDEIETLHGLQVNITTSASDRDQGMSLFKGLGFPFKSEDK